LRITLSAAHEEAHVDRLLDALETLRLPAAQQAAPGDHV
jgi:8-amino-7-oxononanoate synthase